MDAFTAQWKHQQMLMNPSDPGCKKRNKAKGMCFCGKSPNIWTWTTRRLIERTEVTEDNFVKWDFDKSAGGQHKQLRVEMPSDWWSLIAWPQGPGGMTEVKTSGILTIPGLRLAIPRHVQRPHPGHRAGAVSIYQQSPPLNPTVRLCGRGSRD